MGEGMGEGRAKEAVSGKCPTISAQPVLGMAWGPSAEEGLPRGQGFRGKTAGLSAV